MIKLFRLITGEEIVGEVETGVSTEKFHCIKNPCAIGIVMGSAGTPTMNMHPWLMFSSEKHVTLKDEHIMFVTEVDIKIQNKYNEIFGSGIVIAQSSMLP
jgi:hypothetical protein